MGFSVPVGPLQFGEAGWRDRARQMLKDGDLVVLVGTKSEPTAEKERGLLLGLMEPSTEPVMSLDFELPTLPEHFDQDHQYKWPYALLNRRAWRLIDRPALEKISSRSFNMDAAAGIVALTADETKKVLELKREEAPLLQASIRAQARVEGLESVRRRSSPPPTLVRRGIMHLRNDPAFTYAMQLVGSSQPAFKIGWAFDYKVRARNFNSASIPSLGGITYKPVLYQLWRRPVRHTKWNRECLDILINIVIAPITK